MTKEKLVAATRRKIRQGVVVSDKMDATIVILVKRTLRHPLYMKLIQKSKKYLAHDPGNTCRVGEVVRIVECRPLSRRKRYRLLEVLGRNGDGGTKTGTGTGTDAGTKASAENTAEAP